MTRVFIKVKGEDDFGKQYYGTFKDGSTAHKYQHHYPRTQKGDILLYYYPTGDGSKSDNRPMLGVYKVTDDQEHYRDREGFTYEAGIMKRLTGPQRTGGFTEWHQSIQKSDPDLWKKVEDLLIPVLRKYHPEHIID